MATSHVLGGLLFDEKSGSSTIGTGNVDVDDPTKYKVMGRLSDLDAGVYIVYGNIEFVPAATGTAAREIAISIGVDSDRVKYGYTRIRETNNSKASLEHTALIRLESTETITLYGASSVVAGSACPYKLSAVKLA